MKEGIKVKKKKRNRVEGEKQNKTTETEMKNVIQDLLIWLAADVRMMGYPWS